MSTLFTRRAALGSLMLLVLSACGQPVTQPAASATAGSIPAATATQAPTATTQPATPTIVPPAESPSPTTPATTAQPATPTPEPATPTPNTDAGFALPSDQPWVLIGPNVWIPGSDKPVETMTEGDRTSVHYAVAAPDGSTIAYATLVAGRIQLVVLDLRTGQSRVMQDAVGEIFSRISFSPDSTALAFTSIGPNEWQLKVMGLVSGEQRVLQQGSMLSSATMMPLPLVPVGWSAAGLMVEQILYASDAPPRGLALVDPSSAAVTMLRNDSHLQAIPAPDGSAVALILGELPPGGQPRAAVVHFDVASRTETELMAEQRVLIRALRWSPDSSLLAYASASSYDSQETEVGVLKANGSQHQLVTFGVPGFPYRVRDLAWQDAATPLVLLTNEQEQVELNALPLSSFDATGLRPLATFDATGGVQPAQILYTPR